MLRSFDSLRKVFAYASTLLVHRRIASNSPCAIKQPNVSSADIKRVSRYPSLTSWHIASNSLFAVKSNLSFLRQTSNGESRYPSLTIRRTQRTMPAPIRATWRFFGRHQTGVPLPITDELVHCIKHPLHKMFGKDQLDKQNNGVLGERLAMILR